MSIPAVLAQVDEPYRFVRTFRSFNSTHVPVVTSLCVIESCRSTQYVKLGLWSKSVPKKYLRSRRQVTVRSQSGGSDNNAVNARSPLQVRTVLQ